MTMTQTKSDALVWFGCTGDLGLKMTFPALFRMERRGMLQIPIVGVASSAWTHDDLVERARQSVDEFGGGIQDDRDAAAFDRLAKRLTYVDGDYGDASTFKQVSEILAAANAERPAHYLAIPPGLFETVITALGRAGLADQGRVIVEKPFGRDLESARDLSRVVHEVFPEERVFRIDHYLGKESVLGIMYARFANSMLEPFWNRDTIDSVQITMAEDFGIAGRGKFYEGVGALRDVVQNHVLQIVTLLAMEPPIDIEAGSVRAEADKVLRAIDPLSADDLVRGQFDGYRDEPGVAADSDVETFAALRFEIDNWRWGGVPWFVRAGKNLPVRATEAHIRLRKPPAKIFPDDRVPTGGSDYVRIRVTPDGQLALGLRTKEPGPQFAGELSELLLHSEPGPELTAYERLFGDALEGDQTLFTSVSGVEAAWAIVDGVTGTHDSAERYMPGTWGPVDNTDHLIGRHGPWYDPEPSPE